MPHANVVLIPTIDEYHSAGIAHRLWYNEYDFRSFKTSTAKEVQSFVKDKPKISNKEALKLYCQQLGEEEGKEEQRPIEVVASVTESVSPVSTATIAVEEVPVATPLVTVSEEEDAKNSDSNNKDEKDGQEETLENILMILAKELGCEEAAVAGNSDVNMSVHIITYYERFRSDSLTLPNSNNSRKMHNNSNNNNNNNLIASGPALDAPPQQQQQQQQQQQAAAAAFVPSSLPQQQQGEEGWTVFNLLPEMNRSSETLAILAQLIALVSLTVVIPSE